MILLEVLFDVSVTGLLATSRTVLIADVGTYVSVACVSILRTSSHLLNSRRFKLFANQLI